MVETSTGTQRRIDLDWIRIAAFGLLILYHVGMVFVPWYYHVKSHQIVPALQPVMLVLNPWRLSLLFVVAGAATRFMSAATAPGRLLKQRSARLLPPLLFGMVVIVPPQPFWEVVSRHLYDSGFLSFYAGRYWMFSPQFCESGRCIMLPTWNHLWFVAYLWVYTAVLMVLVAAMPAVLARIEQGCARQLSGIGLFVLPIVLFGLYRVALFPSFPPNNSLVGDWYNHALYFSMFAIGFFVARAEPVWSAMVRWRWIAVAVAAVFFVGFLSIRIAWPPGAPISMPLLTFQRVSYATYQWCCIVAVLGFGRRWISEDSRARRYLTEAIFPYYIVHQTIIVGVAFALRDAGLSAWSEAALIIAATAAGCVLTYEVVKRFGWLRPLFGLKPQATAA